MKKPLRWRERVLLGLVPREYRGAILEDLRERFELMAREDEAAARRWYRRQLLSAMRPHVVLGWPRGAPAGATRPSRSAIMDGWRTDLVHGMRRLSRRAGFAALVAIMLALGIGGITAVFGIFEPAVVTGSLATLVQERTRVPRAHELHVIVLRDSSGVERRTLPLAEAAPLLAAEAGLAVHVTRSQTVRFGESVSGAVVSAVAPTWFRMLEVRAVRGRVLAEADRDQRAAVVSHRFWRTRAGGDAGIIGSTIHVDREPFTVVGVLGDGFSGPDRADVWIPLAAAIGGGRPSVGGAVAGANLPGSLVTRARERAELAPLEARLSARLHNADREAGRPQRMLRLANIREPQAAAGEQSAVRSGGLLMFLLSMLVLVAACANVANLLGADSATRSRELAVRASLGAGRRRIVLQLIRETLPLAGIAVALGVLLAFAFLRVIPLWLPNTPEAPLRLELRPGALAIAALAGVLSVLLSSLTPALQATRGHELLRSRSGYAPPPRRRVRLRDALLGAQVVQSQVLLVITALLGLTLVRIRSLPTGFERADTALFGLSLPRSVYDSVSGPALQRDILARVRALPGVRVAALVTPLPVIGYAQREVTADGRDAQPLVVRHAAVSDGYFDAMGTRLLQGIAFHAEENAAVAVITPELARGLWPDGDALGRELVTVEGDRLRVIGIAEDGTYGGVTPVPYLFTPVRRYARVVNLIVRSNTSASTLVPALRSVLRELDPDLPIDAYGSLDTLLDRSHVFGRGLAALAMVFGTLALIICALGIYAHVSHYVSSRRHELGLRLAIGASPLRLAGEVLASGLRVAAISLVVGAVLAIGAGRLISVFLYGVRPAEPSVLVGVSVALASIALAAMLLPARRAGRTAVASALTRASS